MSFDPNQPPAVEATPTATPAPQAPVTPPAQPQATPAVSQPTATVAQPSEDRSNWVPPHRLREQRSQFERELANERAQYTQRMEELNKKLQILAGVTPPENPQIDQVKNQFKEVFPDLDYIGSNAQQIRELLELKDALKASMEHQWAFYNRNAMDRLYKAAEGTYGQSLSDEAKRQLGSSFVGYLQSNPDAYERYQQDPSIVEDYWKAFSERFIDPVRRNSTVQTLNRIPQGLPQDNPSGNLAVTQPVKPANQDERLARALEVYKATSKTGFGS